MRLLFRMSACGLVAATATGGPVRDCGVPHALDEAMRDNAVILLQSTHTLTAQVNKSSAGHATAQKTTSARRSASSSALSHTHVSVNNALVDKALVQVYYETRCPYSIEFLNDSLRQAWGDPDLRTRMTVKLYPYGNAQAIAEEDISEGFHFWHPNASYPYISCQHEEAECFGNMIEACAIDMLKDQELHVPYVLCMSSYQSNVGFEKASYECGQELQVNMTLIKNCVESDRGYELILGFGNLSSKANFSGVPYVLVQTNQTNDASLLEAVCKSLTLPRPTICANYSADVSEETGGGSGCGDSESGSLC